MQAPWCADFTKLFVFFLLTNICISIPLDNTVTKDVVISPKDPSNVKTVEKIIGDVIKETDRIHVIKTPHRPQFSGIECWKVSADSTELDELKIQLHIDDVSRSGWVDMVDDTQVDQPQNLNEEILDSSLVLPRSTAADIAAGVVGDPNPKLQKYASDDLKVISWPPQQTFANLQGYAYLPQQALSTNRTANVIVIDNGYDQTKNDFPTYNRPAWLYPPGRSEIPSDADSVHHGSCVTAKAVGTINGVKKNATGSVMLKIPLASVSDNIWAFSTARDLYMDNRTETVVVYARAGKPQGNDPFWPRIKELIQEIFDAGGIVVTAAGNAAETSGREQVDQLPPMWASPDFPLIVVGAVDNVGYHAPFSQRGKAVIIYAPGVGISCPHSSPSTSYYGTSFAAPMVAGVLANWLSLPKPPFQIGGGNQTAHAAWDYLANNPESGWARVSNGPKVIWNGLDGSKIPGEKNVKPGGPP